MKKGIRIEIKIVPTWLCLILIPIVSFLASWKLTELIIWLIWGGE